MNISGSGSSKECLTSDRSPMSFDLNKHAARLLMQEPFFAALSRTIEKRATTAIPTAGVRINPRSAQFELLYNPEFLGSLPDNQKLGVLKHVIFGDKVDVFEFDTVFNLFEFIGGIIWELSFQGTPKECAL